MTSKKTNTPEPPTSEIELSECSFILPVKLSQSTSHLIWGPAVDRSSRLFIDFGGSIPKLILRSKEGAYVRHIPYHCTSGFKVK